MFTSCVRSQSNSRAGPGHLVFQEKGKMVKKMLGSIFYRLLMDETFDKNLMVNVCGTDTMIHGPIKGP